MRSFVPFYQYEMQEAILGTGAAPNAWFGLALARGSDPAPFTVERYHALFPYTAQASFEDRLIRFRHRAAHPAASYRVPPGKTSRDSRHDNSVTRASTKALASLFRVVTLVVKGIA